MWGNTDNAANSVTWVGSLVNKPANSAIQTALFGNTTANAFVTNISVGQFGVSADEVTAARAAGDPRPAHAGWVLRTEGTGGRAGRVQQEVLVAMSSLGGDAEDVLYPDFTITITSQPTNVTANSTVDGTFFVLAGSSPLGANLQYAWTYANGTTIATNANVGPTNTANLVIDTAVQTSNAAFKVTISATGADTVTSANATLTVV